MVTIPIGQLPWVLGLTVAILAFGAWVSILAVGDIKLRRARRRKGRAIVDRVMADHDAEIVAVAELGLAERPELADDAAAVARTVLALEEVAELRRQARADGEEAAFVTPGYPRIDALLAEAFPRTKNAPKEGP